MVEVELLRVEGGGDPSTNKKSIFNSQNINLAKTFYTFLHLFPIPTYYHFQALKKIAKNKFEQQSTTGWRRGWGGKYTDL